YASLPQPRRPGSGSGSGENAAGGPADRRGIRRHHHRPTRLHGLEGRVGQPDHGGWPAVVSAPSLDPITLELVRSALESTVDEMALTLVRTAYSANLKNAMDLSSAICDADMHLIAQGLTLPLHLGSLPDAMEAVRARYGDRVRSGDVYILNDPY